MRESRKTFQEFLDDLSESEADVLAGNVDKVDDEFVQMVPKEIRSEKEQFLTPSGIAEFMIDWCIKRKNGSIFDPAVGTGVFLSKAVEKAPELSLHGYDIDSLMLRATRVRLECKVDCLELNLQNMDFLSDNFPVKYDYLVCNPPFKKFKEYENSNIAEWLTARYGVELNEQANLYSAFLIHAYSFLKQGGRAAFITPNEFIYSNYGKVVKQFLKNNFRIEALILLDSEEVFDEILTTPVITLLSKNDTSGQTKFIKLDDWVGADKLMDMLKSEPTNTVPQQELDIEINWLNYFTDYEIRDSSLLKSFNSIADIKRGIATGHNEYFLFTKSEIEGQNLPPKAFSRVVAKSGHCRNLILNNSDLERLDKEGKPTYLLYHVDCLTDELSEYLEYGRTNDVHERYLASNRSPWYRVERRQPAPILATTFSRDDMRFILNSAEVRNLTAFHSIYPKYNNNLEIRALLAFLNSGVFDSMMELEKRVHGGLGKFEPNDLKRLDVLDIGNLDKKTISSLADLFNNLEYSRLKDGDPEEVIVEIDNLLERLL